ncbi:MAG: glycoside hydrolase family 5 protein [Actinomycetota bacterium]|nr:glycoside hydrolase family 5 protein [Actinomycetota bacterium]
MAAWILSLLVSLLLLAVSLPASGQTVGGSMPHNATTCPPNPTEVHTVKPPLHTCGRLILDADGHLVRLTALEMGSMGAGDADPSTPVDCGHWSGIRSYAAADVARWGFNSVELMISWQNLEPIPPTVHADGSVTHYWAKDYLAALDEAVKGFTDQGVAVVLMMVQSRWSTAFQDLQWQGKSQDCGFGMPRWLYPAGGGLSAMIQAELSFFHNDGDVQAGLVAAWKMVAARYADDPLVVGAVPLTESYDILAVQFPGTEKLRPKDFHLSAFYTRIGKAIRAANPNLLVIFWDQKSTFTKLFAVVRKPRISNAVYGAEFYSSTWQPKGYERLAGYDQRASSWGLPFTMGEFTMFNYTLSYGSPFPNWETNTQAVLRYAKQQHIGWAICCYGTGSFMTEDNPHVAKPGILPLLKDDGF